MTGFTTDRMLLGVSAAVVAAAPVPAMAQVQTYQFDLPAQPLETSLRTFARTTRQQILFDASLVRGKRSPALKGPYSAEQGLAVLLRGSGLAAVRGRGGAYVVRAAGNADSTDEAGVASVDIDPTESGGEIVVTGSRLRGGVSASKQVKLTQEDIRNSGQANLGEAIRSIPQNFSGGNNPGIALGTVGEQNTNLGGGSALNLRGLGQDATLTLLNGRRLSYGAAFQAVDISSIPLDAVERLEVVIDGASAIYGSDAVGGVANVILKRDYDGATTSARLSMATDGGYVRQQYSAVGGSSWSSGGVILAYDFQHNSDIDAGQRSYTSKLDDSTTLWPFQRQHSAIGSLHQNISPAIELRLDALFNRRSTEAFYSFSPSGDYLALGSSTRSEVKAFTLSPELGIKLGGDWKGAIQLVYGEDETRWRSPQYSSGSATATIAGCYCNSTFGVEANAEGPLFRLPGGDARVAIGGGYRSNTMDFARETSFASAPPQQLAFDVSQSSRYAFGEIQLPLVAPTQAIPFADRLVITGAFRYENYPGLDEIVTPKLGIVYAPLPDIELKASWGKSFKAPTLYQRYLSGFTFLYRGSSYGANLPANATVLYLQGGGGDLLPERATSWSLSASLHPRAMRGFQLDVGYFNIDYSDRVVQPISSGAGVLDNPVFADLITRNPDLMTQQAAIAYALNGLQNISGGPYLPANVVAIIDNRYANVAHQRTRGFDVAARYSSALADGATFTFQADATFTRSSREVIEGLGTVTLAGTIFNPPKFRGRGGVSYGRDDLSLSLWLSHVGSVTDTRRSPRAQVDGQTSLDANWRYTLPPEAGLLHGVEFNVGVSNLLNDRPDLIFTSVAYNVPYDSTNYSPLGRVVSLGIRKSW